MQSEQTRTGVGSLREQDAAGAGSLRGHGGIGYRTATPAECSGRPSTGIHGAAWQSEQTLRGRPAGLQARSAADTSPIG